jgi:hypothetical protein
VTYTRWSEWFQPADVVWYSTVAVNEFSTVEGAGGKVQFGLTGATMVAMVDAVKDGIQYGYVARDCWTDDSGVTSPDYLGLSGVGGPSTSYYAAWIGALGIEQDANVKRTLNLWTRRDPWVYAASAAITDPALPINDPGIWPPGATSLLDVEFEQVIYPGSSAYIAASEVVSSSMATRFEAGWSDTGCSYEVYGYQLKDTIPGEFGMWHPHGSVIETGSVGAGATVTQTYPVPDLPAGMMTFSSAPADWELTPLSQYQFAPMIPDIVSGAVPIPSSHPTSFKVGGTWSVDSMTITLRPARVRFKYQFDIQSPLRLFQRDDAQGIIRSARIGGHSDVGNQPSSLQEQQPPRLAETGNVYL